MHNVRDTLLTAPRSFAVAQAEALAERLYHAMVLESAKQNALLSPHPTQARSKGAL